MPIIYPNLTIIIPCHNHFQWIIKAIESVVSDDYINKKVIIVDDGSTDSSWDVICEYLKIKNKQEGCWQTSSIGSAYRFVQANGPACARNHAIKYAWDETHIFGMLDSDDEYLPGKIQKSIEKFTEDPERVGVVYSDYTTVNMQTGLALREYKEPFDLSRLRSNCIVNNNSLVSKLAFYKCGLYDETLRVSEDFDLWLRISEQFVMCHIPENLLMLRTGNHNSTNTVSPQVWQSCWDKTYNKLRSRLGAQQP